MQKNKLLAFLKFNTSKPAIQVLLKFIVLFFILFKILILLGKGAFRLLRSVFRLFKKLARIKRVFLKIFKKNQFILDLKNTQTETS